MKSYVTLCIEHDPMPADALCKFVRAACDWRLHVLSIEVDIVAETSAADHIRAEHERMVARNAEADRLQSEVKR